MHGKIVLEQQGQGRAIVQELGSFFLSTIHHVAQPKDVPSIRLQKLMLGGLVRNRTGCVCVCDTE